MKIEDFIALYTPEEVEKLKRKDIVGRFQNTLGVQKIAANMSSFSREDSPIRSP